MNATLDIENSLIDCMIYLLLTIPILWFLWAQNAKRCHDRNNSGCWQIIPFYFIWMLFGEGDLRRNDFGENPKMPITPDWEWPTDEAIHQPAVLPIDNVDGDGIIKEKE